MFRSCLFFVIYFCFINYKMSKKNLTTSSPLLKISSLFQVRLEKAALDEPFGSKFRVLTAAVLECLLTSIFWQPAHSKSASTVL